jgi:hypothetical protein
VKFWSAVFLQGQLLANLVVDYRTVTISQQIGPS